MSNDLVERLQADAEHLRFRADIGDMGREPDPTCSLRKAAADIDTAAARITALEAHLSAVLSWWPKGSETGAMSKGHAFAEDIQAARAALGEQGEG